MKSAFLLALLPFAFASPNASPNPLAQIITSAAQRACDCRSMPLNTKCDGMALCECQNRFVIQCWSTKTARCSLQLQNCPSAPNFALDYPACGRGLPDCDPGRICRKVDVNCNDNRAMGVGSCLGLCVPPPQSQPLIPADQLQQPKGQQPQQPAQSTQAPWWQPKPAAPKAAPPKGTTPLSAAGPKCPAKFQCPNGTVCVGDPRDRGQTYKCVDAGGICAGFKQEQCPQGQLCTKDPRFSCEGPGCTGICA
ncbi:hypothetical protein EJ06DRAFT_559539 [Trichodelitschia bisporula]|uniref:Uncharacterized protein n=1 Tax=Trichodelitschia bisporula TaxID=703511 RepID=A0A6G1HMB9_9PEZI|nr:hypothetical protein EJ06DRAFT_559539 [Trichodelitschia bisporula]